jgi:hypothetical protein
MPFGRLQFTGGTQRKRVYVLACKQAAPLNPILR